MKCDFYVPQEPLCDNCKNREHCLKIMKDEIEHLKKTNKPRRRRRRECDES